MIFSVQRYIEDYIAGRGLNDADQYVVRLANLYAADRARHAIEADFLKRMRRIQTSFFVGNGLDRAEFEATLLGRLDRKFKKKISSTAAFPGGVSGEKTKLARKTRSIANILDQFKMGVEARAVDAFWDSRTQQKLKPKPESIGQALIALFIRGVLNGKGLVFREIGSGTGYVDIVVFLSTTPHLIELKVLKSKMKGASQLQSYMRTEDRKIGHLILFDARPNKSRIERIPKRIEVPEGRVYVLVVDICPVAPSKK